MRTLSDAFDENMEFQITYHLALPQSFQSQTEGPKASEASSKSIGKNIC